VEDWKVHIGLPPSDLIERGLGAEEAERLAAAVRRVMDDSPPEAAWRRISQEVLRPKHVKHPG
jgi:hypothetical protein